MDAFSCSPMDKNGEMYSPKVVDKQWSEYWMYAR